MTGGSQGSGDGTPGKLTITGLEAYNDKYAMGFNYGEPSISFGADYDYSGPIPGQIKEGKVTLKVWTLPDYRNYSGSDKNVTLRVIITEAPKGEDLIQGDVTVSFTNGDGGSGVFAKLGDW